MHVEVSVALNFVISYLYNKLPRRRVDMFGAELERGLKKKFEGHWYPDKPMKGSGFRCVRVNGEKIDPVIGSSCLNAGLDMEEVKSYLPAELTLWIDPSEVSYRIGEKSPVKILYSDKKEEEAADTMDREVQQASRGFNPEAQCFKPIDSLSSSLSNLSLSPSSPNSSGGGWSNSTSPSGGALFSSTSPVPGFGPAAVLQSKETSCPQFTAATFAQTKFGSTKLKTQLKRPTRLSPTEFGNFFRQRSMAGPAVQSPHAPQQQQQQQPPQPSQAVAPPQPQQQQPQPGFAAAPQRPRSLSPRDPRVEFMMDQQHRLLPFPHQPAQQRGLAAAFQQQQQQQQQQQPVGTAAASAGMLGDFYRHPSSHQASPQHLSPGGMAPGFSDFMGTASPANSLSPDAPSKTFLDGLNFGGLQYSSPLHNLLVAN